MMPFRSPASASFTNRLKRARAIAAAALAALALIVACSDSNVASIPGTSSGVDNPAVAVKTTTATGALTRVTGQLQIYSADQNPAVSPSALVTLPISNSAFTNIMRSDLERVRQALSKRSALSKGSASAGDLVAFTVFVKTNGSTGGVLLDLVYDSTSHKVTSHGTAVESVSLQPRPLVRYEARVAKDPVHGDDCRIFVPGTPFLATLVDSVFVLNDVPPDLLPLRLIGSDGKIYPIPDSLNAGNASLVYRPDAKPLGSIDTAHGQDTIPNFQIFAPSPHEAFLDVQNFLEAKVSGISETDPRLSVVWKWVPDTGHVKSDTLGGKPLPNAEIVSPTSLRSEVKFHGDGIFHFLVSATVGSRTRIDSTVISVRRLPPPDPKILHPAPAESVMLEKPFNIQWQMPGKGPYRIQVSVNRGETWSSIAEHYLSKDSLQFFLWTAPSSLGVSDSCLLRVSDELDSTLHAETKEFFHLIH